MSNILKGILKESNSVYGHSDPAREYGAEDPTYRKRGPYSHTDDDDDGNPFAEYERQQRMFAVGRAQKAAKEKAQRDADHDRLATGTNEGITENDRINPIGSFPKGPKANRPNRPPLKTSAEMADMLNVDIYKFSRLAKIFPNFPKPVEGIRATNGSKLYYNVQEFNKWVKDNDILNFLKQNVGESLDDPWGDQGNFAGDKPFNLGGVSIKNIQTGDTVKYLGQPAKVVAMSKDRKYSRITISKGMGGVTQDVLTSDLQQLGRGTAIEENDNIQTRMRMNDYYDLADAIQEKLKQSIQIGNKELAQKLNKERDELDARVKQYGLMPESEQLDEISNEKLSQYKTAAAADASKADSEGDYKRGDKRFSGIVKATKKQFANDTKKSGIGKGIAEDRFNSKQEVINHFVKNGKSAGAGAAAWERGWRGSTSKKPVELKRPPQKSYHDELDDKRYSSNTFENLGDQLKSKSLEALTLLKQQIEQKRAEDLAQWEQDFRNNVVNKMRSQPVRPPEATPVAQPGEKHSVLKARLAQLNSAIEKQALLDKLIDKLERKGLMTPSMQNDTDTRMHVKYGAKDNYQSLNKKLDNAIATLQNRLYIRKKSGLKEAQEIKFILVIDGKDKFKFPTREEALKVLNDYKAAFPKSNAKIETRAVAKTMYDEDQDLDENLHKWFKEKWVRFGPDGKIRGDCARGDDSEGKPKCLPQSKAQNLGKKGRASAAARKRREDPNPERSGKAINVNTKKTNEEQLDELKCWSGYHRVAGTKAGFPGSCAKNKTNEEGVAEGLNEFAPDSFNGGGDDDDEGFSPEIAKMAQEDGFTKGASLADGATLERAITINHWHNQHGGMYKQYFAKGFKAGRMDKIRHNNKQYNLNLKLMKDGSIRHGEQGVAEEQHSCPHCGGEMVSEELMNEKKDACYYKVKSRYKVWPSAYASGALVKCRKSGADSWGNGGKKNESIEEDQLDEKWTKKYKDSINCSNPKGFSQKAHCAGKQKNESSILEGIKKV